jgi:hypothetical protein
MKYALFDENGLPKAFYDKDIHGDKVPQEVIEITDEQWLEFINNQGRRRWDFENKQVVPYEPPKPSLEEFRNIVNDLRKRKVASLLSKTDYVIIKLQEAKTLGDDDLYNELLQKYQQVLQEREEIRQWNDGIKQKIFSAATVEELEEIKKEIESYKNDT